MEETYGIHEKFLYLENKIFRNMDHIKQLRIYPLENGKCDLIVIYEIEEPEQISQNGHYLSIDLGLHNLMQIPAHLTTHSAKSRSVFPDITERVSASADQ